MKIYTSRWHGCILLIGMTLPICHSWAQSHVNTGGIRVMVTDEAGANLEGAEVSLTHTDTGAQRTIMTSSKGIVEAPLLSVGGYDVLVQKAGFSPAKQTGILVTLGQLQVVNFQLKVGAVTTVVEISKPAASSEASRLEMSFLVDNTMVSGLPINGRRFADLALLSPGVMQEIERNQLSISSARGINSSINLDGLEFTEPFFGGQRGGERSSLAYTVSQESVQEFQVVRGNASAEFGRGTGGVINVLSKSGANDFHGSAFYYLRHKELAPRDALGDERAPTRQQFGGSLGGPIVKNRTFFYNVYDQQTERQPLIIRFNNPTGLPPEILNQQGIQTSTNGINTYLAKLDHQFSYHRLFARYNFSRNQGENATYTGVSNGTPSYNGTEADRIHTAALSLTSTLSPTRLNELRGQYSYEVRPRINNLESGDFVSNAGPTVLISGCCVLGGVSLLPTIQHDSRWELSDNLSLIQGSHNLKVGFDYSRSYADQTFRGNWRGSYAFSSTTAYLHVINHDINPATKLPYTPDIFSAFFGEGRFQGAENEYAVFVEDSYRASSKLSLDVGLRYEAAVYPQPVDPNSLLTQTSKINNDITMWQPRFGLTWNPTGNGKLIIRLGGGLYNAQTPLLLINQAFTANGSPTVGSSFTLTAPMISAFQRIHPEFVFPFVPDTSKAENASYFASAGIPSIRPDATFFEPDFRNPRSLQYTLGVERQLTGVLSISLDYIHNHTVHLERIHDVNLPFPKDQLDNSIPPVVRPRFDLRLRPNPNFNVLRQYESSARSNYDGVTLSLNHRYSRRLMFLASYTLAYNRDDDSNERNFQGITYENAYDLQAEYRWSRNDIRHRGVLSGIYDLPRGFQVGSILEWRTGTPFSAFTGVDSNGDGQFTDRPIVAGIPLLRNSFRQPNYFHQDLRLSKTLSLHERYRLALIGEMFNLWNVDNLSYNVSTNESTTTALGGIWGRGQIPLPTFRTLRFSNGSLNRDGINAGMPFQLQLALRFTF